MLAVVEAKSAYRLPGDGLQQAKVYAEILGVKFAYSTNGHGIVEFDFTTGQERRVDASPSRRNCGSASAPAKRSWTTIPPTNY
jgi:type I restriction enzyme R subunit